jgi:hypothetical protein
MPRATAMVMRHPTLSWFGLAIVGGALLALGRSRNAVLRGLAELAGELAAAALVAHATSLIDREEAQRRREGYACFWRAGKRP